MLGRIIPLCALSLYAAACGSPTPATTATATSAPSGAADRADDGGLAFEKFRLDNGLTVILHKDDSDPIVAMATIVHVGSSREKPGRTGFAHFFEHMSFNNSENVPMGANRKMIPELGGTRNGGTWSDGTMYYEVVPKDAFEKLMWIDSDRFGYMINTVREGTLEREKQVVKNEKRQRVDNRPYGHTEHVIRKALYPKGHPYSWTVIGDLEDLQAATLDDVREFYFEYYVPSNATLVVAGDIDFDETRAMVEKWFGEIKGVDEVADLEPVPVTLKQEKRLFHLDNFAKVPELRLTFPTVEEYHPDSYALEALGKILSDGKSAPLYRTIVEKEKLSSSVGAYQSSSELAGTFSITVRANPGVDLDAVYAAIGRSLDEFEDKGFRPVDLETFKAQKETRFYSGMESILNRALELGIYEEFAGDPGYMSTEIEQLRKLTSADIRRVYDKYIADQPAVITSFVPRDRPDLILEGSEEATVVEEKIVEGAEAEFVEVDSEDFERTPTSIDRSEPALGKTPEPRVPDVWRASSQAGIEVLGIEHSELPMVSFNMRIDGGQWLDPQDKVGVASLTAQLLNEGTANKTPLELEDAIGLLGARLRIYATKTSIEVSGETLAANFDRTMALMSEMLLEPRWDEAEFERLKIAQLAEIKEREGSPTTIARNTFYRQIYGDSHVAGQPMDGTESTVKKIELPDLKSWYKKSVSPQHATLHVTGAVDQAQVLRSIERLDREWKGAEVVFPGLPEPKQAKRPKVFFIDVPGSKQSVIYAGKSTVRGDDPVFYRLTVVNDRLGSGSSARLTQTLRIQKGYSYGAYSYFECELYPGAFVASSSVRSNVTLESLQIFVDLIGNYAETFTEEDLSTTKNRLAKAETRAYETRSQLRGYLSTMSLFDLPADYIETQRRELESLSLAEVHALVKEHLGGGQMIYVVVGDAKTQLKNVSKLGYGRPVRLDRDGAPL